MNNIVEFIERRKNESRKKMLHFSSYSDLGSDVLCLFYDNFLHFNFPILNLNEWFSIF